ncbi:MAG TPA: AAA family ATPase [Candidatus Sulfotelmatobacter sp.]|nr:AAA family ATPase [Candidatus Sulfotelmatobacter sp.]
MDSALSIDQQIQKLEEKIINAKLPQDLLEKINSMLTILKVSLKSGTGNFINYESISNYVDWVASLPFHQETQDTMDLNNVKETLDKNHYGLQSVKNNILEYLSALILNMKTSSSNEVRAPILCLVGLVGTGKTTLAISIAEAMGRKFERIPFGGMGDSLALRGQSRAFSDAEPGQVIKKLAHAASKNSVILLDELDRVSEQARADIMGVLVELLDPEQNKAFTDHYIDYPFDLSHVLFIATANNTTNISTAVLDRLEIIQMPSYSDEEKTTIAQKYLFPKIKKEAGLSQMQLTIDDSLWPSIIRPLGYDSGIRSLERTMETMARRIARMVVEGKLQPNGSFAITQENIKGFLPA